MIAWLRTHWRWLLPVATFAAGWFAHRPQAAVHQVATASSMVAQTAKMETAQIADVKLEQRKVAAGTVTVRTRYLPARCGEQQLAERIETRVGPVTTETSKDAATATTARSESQAVAQQQSSLDLTITPQPQPGWAVGAGLDGLSARTLRLSARRRVFGPFWAEISAVPATRSVGAGLAVEW